MTDGAERGVALALLNTFIRLLTSLRRGKTFMYCAVDMKVYRRPPFGPSGLYWNVADRIIKPFYAWPTDLITQVFMVVADWLDRAPPPP